MKFENIQFSTAHHFWYFSLVTIIIIFCHKINEIKIIMDNDPNRYYIEKGKNKQISERIQKWSNQSAKNQNDNNESLQLSDWETKASSHISAGTHQTSFDFSESSFQNQHNRPQDFFREDFLLQRKITKKQLSFRQEILNAQFLIHISELLQKFTQHANSFSFQNLLKHVKKPELSIFQSEELKALKNSQKLSTFKQVFEGLIFERKNWFFIYTFDLLVCHLTFFILLIYYWMQLDITETKKSADFSVFIAKKKSDGFRAIQRNTQTRHNIISIVKAYIKCHTQQINENQVLFLLAIYFLDSLKHSNQHESLQLDTIQKKLIKEIKNLRKVQMRQGLLQKTNNQRMFEYKLRKYESGNIFVSFAQTFYQLLRSHSLSNSSVDTIAKYYDFDEVARKDYQMRKDAFCLWVLQTVMKDGQQKSSVVLRNASNLIIQVMGVLKKFKTQNNICGISYLVPIVANIKTLLPKAWKHAAKRRPEIQSKLNQYSDFMLQNKYKVEELGEDAVLWRETVYTMTDRMLNAMAKKKGIDIEEHSKYYDQFLSHFLHFRHRSKQAISRSQFQLELAHETNSGFNISLLENYLLKKYGKSGISESWNQLTKRSQKINEIITESLIADIFDYCFIGSTEKYKQVDL